MNEEDFACDNFAPQRWRKDTCRKCYQPLRLHEKKKERTGDSVKPSGAPFSSPQQSPPNIPVGTQKRFPSFSAAKSKPPMATPAGNKQEDKQSLTDVRPAVGKPLAPSQPLATPISQPGQGKKPEPSASPSLVTRSAPPPAPVVAKPILPAVAIPTQPLVQHKPVPAQAEKSEEPSISPIDSRRLGLATPCLAVMQPTPPLVKTTPDTPCAREELSAATENEVANSSVTTDPTQSQVSTECKGETAVPSEQPGSQVPDTTPMVTPSQELKTLPNTNELSHEQNSNEIPPTCASTADTSSTTPVATKRSSRGGPPPRPPPRSSSTVLQTCTLGDLTKLLQDDKKEQEMVDEPEQEKTETSVQTAESDVSSQSLPQEKTPVILEHQPVSSPLSHSVPPPPPPRAASTVLQTVQLPPPEDKKTEPEVTVGQSSSSMVELAALLGNDQESAVVGTGEQVSAMEKMAALLAEQENEEIFNETVTQSETVPLLEATSACMQPPDHHVGHVEEPPQYDASPLDTEYVPPPPPPPPPPLPPIEPPAPSLPFTVKCHHSPEVRTPSAQQLNVACGDVAHDEEEPLEDGEQENQNASNVSPSAHKAAMALIVGGVSLRHVSPPPEKTVVEEAIVDVASEMRVRVRNQKKKEVEAHSDKFEELRPQVHQIVRAINSANVPTYLHVLVDLLKRIDLFVGQCGVPVEVLVQRLDWPSILIDDLREVVSSMANLEDKVVMAEKVCQHTLESDQFNVEKVHQCVTQVITTATLIKRSRNQDSRYTRASNNFPVDQIDIHRLVQRAAAAVTPLLDKLYQKALQSHDVVHDPSATKYDLTFRLQNAMRLLRMCCNMSDSLSNSLEIERHHQYSEAMLKVADLNTVYQKQVAILEKRGDWDPEESVQLKSVNSNQKPFMSQKDQATVSQMVIAVLIEGGTLDDAVAAVSMSEHVFLHEELQLIRSTVSCGHTHVLDHVMELRGRFCSDESLLHRRDFDWLYEAVSKSKYECIERLVKVHGVSINCSSPDIGNRPLHIAARRPDWSMMQFLIELGADPLLMNNSSRTPLELIGLKCFPQQHFPELKEKELPFDLESYVNNPSLSDVVLVSSDGDRFYAHRLLLCGQSPVFHSMMESAVWRDTSSQDSNEVTLSSVSSHTLRLLLQYLYTGKSMFPNNDLNTWIDLLAASTEFLLGPLKLQCERVLSSQIDNEVLVPMYYAAERFSANKLLINCCRHMLMNYKHIDDENHGALLHLIENGAIFASKPN